MRSEGVGGSSNGLQKIESSCSSSPWRTGQRKWVPMWDVGLRSCMDSKGVPGWSRRSQQDVYNMREMSEECWYLQFNSWIECLPSAALTHSFSGCYHCLPYQASNQDPGCIKMYYVKLGGGEEISTFSWCGKHRNLEAISLGMLFCSTAYPLCYLGPIFNLSLVPILVKYQCPVLLSRQITDTSACSTQHQCVLYT